jgi:AcrR family transcriptional regulator
MNIGARPLHARKDDPRWGRTRQALLDAGRKVFSRKGVETVTVLEIVREAGVSQPSFYNHFASKEALVEAIAADFFAADVAHKVRVFDRATDPAEAIARNAMHTLRVARRDAAVAWVMVRSGVMRDLLRPGARDDLVRMISLGARRGRFHVADSRVAAAAIRGAAYPLLQDILLGRAPPDVERQFARLLLQMLGLPHGEAAAVAARADAGSTEEGIPPVVRSFNRRTTSCCSPTSGTSPTGARTSPTSR